MLTTFTLLERIFQGGFFKIKLLFNFIHFTSFLHLTLNAFPFPKVTFLNKKTVTFATALAPPVRLELTTHWLTASCSTNWAKEECFILNLSTRLNSLSINSSNSVAAPFHFAYWHCNSLSLEQSQHLPTELRRNIIYKKLATSYFPNKVTRKYLRH